MENDEQQKKKRYLRVLSLLYMQIDEFNQMKDKSIKDNNRTFECYLVNKDMIDNYKELFLYETISKFIQILKEKKKGEINFDYFSKNNILDNVFNNIGIDFSKLEPIKKKLIPPFFEVETLKIQGYAYPYNFFILRKEIFDSLFEKEINNNNIEFSNTFKLYKMLIGKEGVFIWNLNKQKGYISIYFSDDCSSEINKIYLYKEEEEFLKELNKNIITKGRREYFLFRNIKNNDLGLFNLIDDGKIIGKYINVFRSQKFEEKTESKESNNLVPLVKKDEQKIGKINDFIKYLLINLFYIEDLRKYSFTFEKEENSLLGAYSSFAKSYEENINSNLSKQINTFINVFSGKSLGDSVQFNEENKNQALEKLIENVIDTFNKETNQELKKIKANNKGNDFQNKILDLFYGEKNIENSINQNNNNNNNQKNNKKAFFTLYIDSRDLTYGMTSISLNNILDINNLKKKKIDIQKLPNLLIIIIENNGLVEVPFELNISYGYYKKDYKFLSSIRKYDDNIDNYFSIVKIGNNLYKTHFNYTKNSYESEEIKDNNELRNELNKSIIFFYETTMREVNYSSGNNEIFTSASSFFSTASIQPTNYSSNSFIANCEGYQDINNTGNLIYNQFYNNNNTNMINNNNINNNNNIYNK